MYSNTQALPRPDINAFVLEALGVESLLIAERIFGVYPSPTKAGTYPKVTIQTGELLKPGDGDAPDDFTLRAKDGSYNETTRATTDDAFDCLDRGLEERVDDAYAADAARFFNAEVLAATLVLRQMRMAAEKRAASVLFNPSNFAATNMVAPLTEAGLANVDFARDITDAIDRLTGYGIVPNTLVMNSAVWNRLRRSPKLQTYMFGNLPSGQQRTIRPADIGAEFGIQNVFVAAIKADSAKRGKAPSLGYIWPSTHIWLGNVASGGFENGGAVRQIVWTGDAPQLYVTETYRNEARRSDMVRVRQNSVEKVLDSNSGALLTTQWA